MRIMRLLRAELRKLLRPLPLAMLCVAFILTSMVVRQQVVNLSAKLGKEASNSATSSSPPYGRLHDEVVSVSPLETPAGIGKAAADEMASLVGAVVILFLAGAHMAGEWSGRTLKTVLTAESRRWRVLLAKTLSLWIAGVVTLAGLWLLLAGFSFFLSHAWRLAGQPNAAAALRFAGPDLLRATFVLGAFAVLGLCAAVVTRSMLGTVVAGLLVLGLAMELVNISDVTRFSPAYWIDGWMRFQPPGRVAADPLALWNTSVPVGVPAASMTVGAVGLVLFAAALGALAWLRFRRCDITV
jgi:ABC-type transport system involved in multi-copper enzyme maturation permease subunit